MRFSAAVLVGGYSRRMGRDKAALPAPPYGSLLERQLAQLSVLRPVELLVAAREGQAVPRPRVNQGPWRLRITRDAGSTGPLGGLTEVLRTANTGRVLVLAVDLPFMQPSMLRRLLGALPHENEDVGVVARLESDGIQPLAGLWPRSVLELVEEQVRTGDRGLRTLVARTVDAGLMRVFDVPTWDAWQFANWNQPDDIMRAARPPQRKPKLDSGGAPPEPCRPARSTEPTYPRIRPRLRCTT